MTIRRAIIAVLVVLAAGGGYWYVTSSGGGPARPPSASAPPPPEVTTLVVSATELALPLEYAGRVAAFRDVEIRAQVGGTLLKREFAEGAKVEKGQLLFRIDPRPYEVALERAEAQLAQAQATLHQAEENFTRTDELVRRKVSTQKQYDDAVAARDQGRAAVKVAEAEIATARLNLGYTNIVSPISGPTRLLSPPEGALVLAQQTLLTTIQQLDPAYVNFSVTDGEYQALVAIARDRVNPIKPETLTFRALYGNGRAYGEIGRLDNSSSFVDMQTGTIQVRAVFPNKEGQLLPGQFVRIEITGMTLLDALLVPKPAISQGPQGPFVYVVGPGNVVAARPVKLGRELTSGWVITNGLKSGEQIVVDGVMRVRPGAPVRPATAPAAGAAAPAGQAAVPAKASAAPAGGTK